MSLPLRHCEERSDEAISSSRPDAILDCYGLLCPVPVRKTAEALERLSPGQILQVIATDEWFGPDLEAWLAFHPHELLAIENRGEETHAYVRKQKGVLVD